MFLRLGFIEWVFLIILLAIIIRFAIHLASQNQPWKQDELRWRMFTAESELDDLKAQIKTVQKDG